MRTESEALRRQVAALGQRTRGARLPEDLRSEIARYAKGERRRGAGMREIANSIGVSAESIRRWTTARSWNAKATTRSASRALIPVVVHEDRDAGGAHGVSLSAPSGYRVEGLSIAEAGELLRLLA